MHIHILGICGTFMGSLALLARELGHRVTGVDQHVFPPMSTQLESAGITLTEGYASHGLESLQPDMVLIGNALSRGNPAVEYVLSHHLAYQSGPEWLAGQVLFGKHVLAVAGTHGKTTTTSMLAWILDEAGMQPGFLIGGVPANFGYSARVGSGDYFVIEADEYDTAFFDKRSKFIHYHPDTLVLNNLEFDHADIFDDLAAIQRQFHHLIRTVPKEGRVLMPDEPELQSVITQGFWSELQLLNCPAGQWQVQIEKNDNSIFNVFYYPEDIDLPKRGERLTELSSSENKHSEEGCVKWQLSGQHNIQNAVAAIAAARHVGVSVSDATKALSGFQSVKRRMELIGEVNGIKVYDDFAHHPTAIQSSLAGMRAKSNSGRILAVIELRSNTMQMGVHNDTLGDAIQEADFCWWYESKSNALSSGALTLKALFTGSDNISVFSQHADIVAALVSEAKPGDTVVIMSNGGFEGIHQQILDAL